MVAKWWHDFHESLVRVVDIEGVVVNESLVRVGRGREVFGEVDSPVIKYPDGTPFIPGSSVKGVFRSLAESVIYNLLLGGKEDNSSYCGVLKGIGAEEFVTKCVNPGRDSGGEEEGEQESPDYCVNHALFGSQEGFSHLVFFDITPLDSSKAVLMVKPGTSIDRFLGSVREKTLFKEEYVSPGVEWRFRMRIYGVLWRSDGYWCCAREILALLLEMFSKTGISIGGRKSVTGALIKLDKEKTTVKVYEVKNDGISCNEMRFDEFIEKLRRCEG